MTKKRICSLLACLSLLLLLFSGVAALAAAPTEEGPAIWAEDKTVTAGNTFTLYVKARGLEGVAGLSLTLYYDATQFRYNGSPSAGSMLADGMPTANTGTAGQVRMEFISTTPVSGDGTLWSIGFQALSTATVGEHTFTLAVGEVYNAALEGITVASGNAKITVNAANTTKTVNFYTGQSATSVKSGESATVSLRSGSMQGLASADFEVEYDQTLLALDKAELGTAMTEAANAVYSINTDSPGYVKITYVAPAGLTGSVNPILKLTFTALQNADAVASVKFKVTNIHDVDLATMNAWGTLSTSLSLVKTEVDPVLPVFSLGNYEGVDNSFTLDLTVPGSVGLAAADFTVTFDSAMLQCTAVERLDSAFLVVSNIKNDEGTVTFSFICENGVTADQAIVRLTFSTEGLKGGDTAVAFSGKNMTDAAFYTVLADFAGGTVVLHKHGTAATCTEDEICSVEGCDEVLAPRLGHALQSVAEKASTCTVHGHDAYEFCTRCDYTTYQVRPLLAHTPGDPATCTTDQLCTACEAVLTDRLGHLLTAYSKKEPTCTEIGHENYSDCARCDYTTYVEIPATGHSHVTSSVAPTCTEKGYSLHVCSACNDTYATDFVDAAGHVESNWITDKAATCTGVGYKHIECTVCDTILQTAEIAGLAHTEVIDAAVAATCTATGLTEGKHCSVCNTVLTAQTDIPANGHTESAWITDTAATCTGVGYKHVECTVCDAILQTAEIAKLAHTEVIDAAVAATCTATGLTQGKHCSVCNTVLVKQTVTVKLAHTEVTDDAVAATCTATGLSEGKHCSVCNTVLVKQAVIGKLAHAEVIDNAVAATCTATGLTQGKHCSVCSTVLVAQTEIPANGHTESAWITDTVATCTGVGYKHIECTVCDTILQTGEIAKLAHTEVIDAAVAATCTATGLTQGKHCSVCNTVLTAQTEIPATGHTESAWITDKAATCTGVGYKHVECTVCDAILQTGEIAKLAHTEVIDAAVAATCTAKGLTEGKHCSVCSTVLVAQTETPAVGHIESEWIVDQVSTSESIGYRHKECTVCGQILKVESIPMSGHHESEWIIDVEPTCGAIGSRYKKCMDEGCGIILVREILPVLTEHMSVVTDAAVAETCTSTGLTVGKHCSTCGQIIEAQAVVPKKDHVPSDWITDTASTCTGIGYKHKICTECDAILETDKIEKLAHTEVVDTAVAATCTATGLTEGKHCSVCNTVLVAQTEISAAGHTESAWITDKAATCTGVGYKHVACTVCEAILQTAEIAKLAHTEVVDASVAATCTASGLTQGKHCSVCNTVLVEQNVIEMLKHSEVVDAAVAATCTATGLTEGKHCSVCNTVLVKQTVTEKLAHTEVVDAAVAATCTATGLTQGRHCSVCNTVLVKQTVTEKLAHTEEVDAAVTATCTATGLTEGKHCSICNTVLVKQTVIEKSAHTVVVDKAVAATCTASGLAQGKHCSVCNIVLVAQTEVPATGHTESAWITDTAATCTGVGHKHIACNVCHIILETDEIAKLAHTEVIDAAVAATCTASGLTQGKHCSVCNTVLVAQVEIPATGHTESDWIIDTAATCTGVGYKHVECTVCEAILQTAEIAKLAHTEVIDAAVAATCTASGLTQGKHCSVCNTVLLAQTEVKATGHTPSNWITEKNATCTGIGYQCKKCTACGIVLEIGEIAKLAHTEVVDAAVAATCTTGGLTEGKHCSVCHTVLVAQAEIQAVGHTAGEWQLDAPATCETKGSQHTACTVCHEVLEISEIAPTGHTEVVDVAVDATCAATGLTEGKHCSVCSKVLVAQTVVDRLDHIAGDWIVDAPATREGEGSKHRSCTVCDTVLELATIAKIGSDYNQGGQGANADGALADEEDALPTGAIVAISCTATAVVTLGGSIAWFKLRKKSKKKETQ